MGALDLIVRQGKALYAGISNYNEEEAQRAIEILKDLGTPCVIHQPKYSMIVRDPEEGLLDVLDANGVGCIPFSPLAQGLLTDKYLNGIPEDSRVATSGVFLNESHIDQKTIDVVKKLNEIATARGQKLAHMALAWLLKDKRVTSVLIGASKPSQVTDSLLALENYAFSAEEENAIDQVLKEK